MIDLVVMENDLYSGIHTNKEVHAMHFRVIMIKMKCFLNHASFPI